MKVLVTGGAGYLGSVVARRLLARGHEVRVMDSLQRGGRSLLGLWHQPGFSFLHGDVRDREIVRGAVDGVDAVAHLAAVVGGPACARQPEMARQVNVDGSKVVFDAARRSGVDRFVFASSCSRHRWMALRAGGQSSRLLADEPTALYSCTKAEVEEHLLGAHHGDLSTTVLRFATLFGMSPHMRFDLMVNGFTRELLLRRKLLVFGAEAWRPHVHVEDAARALVTTLEADSDPVRDRIFNVGAAHQRLQKGRLAELVAQQMPHEVEIQHVARERREEDHPVSFRRLTKVLGFRTERSMAEGIAEVRDAIQQGLFSERVASRAAQDAA